MKLSKILVCVGLCGFGFSAVAAVKQTVVAKAKPPLKSLLPIGTSCWTDPTNGTPSRTDGVVNSSHYCVPNVISMGNVPSIPALGEPCIGTDGNGKNSKGAIYYLSGSKVASSTTPKNQSNTAAMTCIDGVWLTPGSLLSNVQVTGSKLNAENASGLSAAGAAQSNDATSQAGTGSGSPGGAVAELPAGTTGAALVDSNAKKSGDSSGSSSTGTASDSQKNLATNPAGFHDYDAQHALNLKAGRNGEEVADPNTNNGAAVSLPTDQANLKASEKKVEDAQKLADNAAKSVSKAVAKARKEDADYGKTGELAPREVVLAKEAQVKAAENLQAANHERSSAKAQLEADTHRQALQSASVSSENMEAITAKGNAADGNCGKYGGANCDKTNSMNGTIKMAQTLGTTFGTNAVQSVGTSATNTVASKGGNATQADIAAGQIKTAKASLAAESGVSVLDAYALYKQSTAAKGHANSMQKVKGTGDDAMMDVSRWDGTGKYQESAAFKQALADSKQAHQAELRTAKSNLAKDCGAAVNEKMTALGLTRCSNDAACNARYNQQLAALRVEQNACKTKDYTAEAEKMISGDVLETARNSVRANIEDNSATEQNRQAAMSKETMQAALTSAGDLAGHVKSILATRNAMNAIQANAALTNGFAYNPGTGLATNPDGVATAPDAGTVVDSTDNLAGTDSGPGSVNLGNNEDVGGGAPDGRFVAANPGANGAGSGGSLGASGGTAAAKPDAAADTAGSNKSQTGGMYASDGPSGSGYRRSDNTPSVGMDNSFADMLKKFLPGGDEDKGKKDGAMAFDDRAPASDQAAVIGRNKNIFEEIHKRYQKKSGEGAVVFNSSST